MREFDRQQQYLRSKLKMHIPKVFASRVLIDNHNIFDYQVDFGHVCPLKKENGRDVIIVKPRALNIVWGNDDRYWNVPGPRDVGKPAELLQVSWLEVAGSVDADPQKTYDVSFRVSLTPDAFGWGSYPIYIMVKRGKFGKFDWKKLYLTNCDGINRIHLTGKSVQNGRENQGSTDRKLYFGLYEVWSGKWKGGLKIHDVTIREV